MIDNSTPNACVQYLLSSGHSSVVPSALPFYTYPEVEPSTVERKLRYTEMRWSISSDIESVKNSAMRMIFAILGKNSMYTPGVRGSSYLLTQEGLVNRKPEFDSIGDHFKSIQKHVESARLDQDGLDSVLKTVLTTFKRIDRFFKLGQDKTPGDHRITSFDTSLTGDRLFYRMIISSKDGQHYLSLRRVLTNTKQFVMQNRSQSGMSLRDVAHKFRQFSGKIPDVSEFAIRLPKIKCEVEVTNLKTLSQKILSHLSHDTSIPNNHMDSVFDLYQKQGVLLHHGLSDAGLFVQAKLASHYDAYLLKPEDGNIVFKLPSIVGRLESLTDAKWLKAFQEIETLNGVNALLQQFLHEVIQQADSSGRLHFEQALRALKFQILAGSELGSAPIYLYDLPFPVAQVRNGDSVYLVSLYATVLNPLQLGSKEELKWRWDVIHATFLDGAVIQEAHLAVRVLQTGGKSSRKIRQEASQLLKHIVQHDDLFVGTIR